MGTVIFLNIAFVFLATYIRFRKEIRDAREERRIRLEEESRKKTYDALKKELDRYKSTQTFNDYSKILSKARRQHEKSRQTYTDYANRRGNRIIRQYSDGRWEYNIEKDNYSLVGSNPPPSGKKPSPPPNPPPPPTNKVLK